MFLGELFCIALFYLQRWCKKSHRSVDFNNGKNVTSILNLRPVYYNKKLPRWISAESLYYFSGKNDNEEITQGSKSNLIGNEKKNIRHPIIDTWLKTQDTNRKIDIGYKTWDTGYRISETWW